MSWIRDNDHENVRDQHCPAPTVNDAKSNATVPVYVETASSLVQPVSIASFCEMPLLPMDKNKV